MSKIEWTNETWNPLIGCTKVSAGCKNCYAIRTAWIRMHNPKMAERYAGTVEKTVGGQLNWTGKINQVWDALEKPLKIKKPTMFFVNSMSDLFHPSVGFYFIHRIWEIMAQCPQHTFQILTKQAALMREYMTEWAPNAYGSPYEPLPNVWLGVSVENQEAANERIPHLLQVPAAVRFLSCEPLLGPVDISSWFYPKHLIGTETCNYEETEFSILQQDLHWVICGGESGLHARPMHLDWARSLREKCDAAGVPFFFKQFGEWAPAGMHRSGTPGKFALAPIDGDGPIIEIDHYPRQFTQFGCMVLERKGKKAAGRLLDGREWNEFPTLNQ